MNSAAKSERLKQVQFRMPPQLHRELRKALIDSNISMADLFNQAAIEYVERNKGEKIFSSGGDRE